jgi:hypothetical protein
MNKKPRVVPWHVEVFYKNSHGRSSPVAGNPLRIKSTVQQAHSDKANAAPTLSMVKQSRVM